MNKHLYNIEIDNEKIQAEYFEFESNIFESSSDLWNKITMTLYRIKHKIRHIYYEIYYGFERMFKDYDVTDIFSIHSKFVERYSKILVDYKNSLHGHPINLTQEEWEVIIGDMIKHLYYMDEENVEKELSKGVPENWTPSCKTVGEIMDKHKNEFFKLFSEYFYNLWD